LNGIISITTNKSKKEEARKDKLKLKKLRIYGFSYV
jgi:hypothetical protein